LVGVKLNPTVDNYRAGDSDLNHISLSRRGKENNRSHGRARGMPIQITVLITDCADAGPIMGVGALRVM
jgi:hypothetical protein